jgi:hypothetical protein
MAVADTLAYCGTATITAVKSLIVKAAAYFCSAVSEGEKKFYEIGSRWS